MVVIKTFTIRDTYKVLQKCFCEVPEAPKPAKTKGCIHTMLSIELKWMVKEIWKNCYWNPNCEWEFWNRCQISMIVRCSSFCRHSSLFFCKSIFYYHSNINVWNTMSIIKLTTKTHHNGLCNFAVSIKNLKFTWSLIYYLYDNYSANAIGSNNRKEYSIFICNKMRYNILAKFIFLLNTSKNKTHSRKSFRRNKKKSLSFMVISSILIQ